MDVHYKTYAGRSSRDIRFDQLLHTKPLSSSSSTAFSKSSVTSRKRVNVVSFVPTGEGQELITKSPDKVVSEISDSSSCAGAIQSDISQSYSLHSVTEGVITASPVLSHSTAYKESSSRQPNRMTDNSPFDHPSDCTFNLGSVRNVVSKLNQYRSDTALTPASALPSQAIKQCVSSPNSHLSVTNYPSHSVCITKPTSHPKLQETDRSQGNLIVTSTDSSSKTQTCIDSSKNTHERNISFCNTPTLEQAVSDASASKSFSRPLLSGKNKRAAYNPRSWQKEIETEDSSPTKLQKVTESSPCSQNQSQSSISSIESHHLFAKDVSPMVSQEDLKIQKNINKPSVDNFAFSEYEEETHNTLDTLHSCKKYSVRDNHSAKYCDKLVEEDEDLEDDVKPWFRPASRDATFSKKLSNSPMNIKVSRTDKPLYTVLHKVKEAHVCQEQGEAQHLLDDVEYLVDGLTDRNQVNTRALSVLTLANKCLAASFRYTLNAHGLLKRICAKLHDAYKDYALALTSAGLLFVLSRDRDPNILDVDSLAIILKLFSAPDTNTNGPGSHCEINRNKEAERVRMRVRQLLDGLHQNHSKNLLPISSTAANVSNNSNTITSSNQSIFSSGKRPILPLGSKLSTNSGLNTRHLQITRQLTTADLVIESILNFGTRKAGDWFKAELRNGGGLDKVADAASDAVDYLADLDPTNTSRKPTTVWRSRTNLTGIDNFALDRLKRVCHYTRLLENMTYMNSDNQTYLVHYRDGILVNRLLICLRVCVSHLPKSATQETSTTNNNTTVNSVTVLSNSTNSTNDSQSILTDCILGIFRFLVNVSHNEFASERLGACSGFLETIFDCLLKLPDRFPGTKRFDVLVLVLCLLVNMCEHCPENRTRIVYLDITKSCLKQSSLSDPKVVKYIDTYDDEEEDYDDNDLNANAPRQVVTTSALDELIQLFLTREECARNHDFERDDDEAVAAAAARKRSEEAEVLGDNPKQILSGCPNPTVEEAGLKWRLIEDRRAMTLNSRSLLGRNKKCLYRKQKGKKRLNKRRQNVRSFDEDDEEDSEDVDDMDDNDDEEDCSEDEDDLGENDEGDDDDDDDDDDDESVGSGADVEFVADTQEEQEKLAESMSQAQQHMEDSVVAAYTGRS
ncbi:Wings apart-like protein like [Schistosoma japonicum]|nr:Wings apart-like protein like [Schistosoma japonicum]